MKKVIHVKIYKGNGDYVADCPDLPVGIQREKDIDEVLKNIKEAIYSYIKQNPEKVKKRWVFRVIFDFIIRSGEIT